MKAVTRHPDAGLLGSYAAGTLDEAFSLLVAAHLSLCDACRAEVGAQEAVGGALLEATPPADLGPDSLARTLERIRGAGDAQPAPTPASGPGDLPAPVAGYVGGGLDAVRWWPVGGGVRQAILVSGKRSSVRLLRIGGGGSLPEHGHVGREATLVLGGAFRDGGIRFGRGDVAIADGEIHHEPVAEPEAECLCLYAVEGRLRFRGLLPRLAQVFARI